MLQVTIGTLAGGGGVGYQLTDDISADVSYEWINDIEVFSVGMRFEF